MSNAPNVRHRWRKPLACLGMADVSWDELGNGEKLWRKAEPARRFLKTHPAAVAGALTATGVVVQMASALINASAVQRTFEYWIGMASAGFGLPVQLVLLVGVFLLLLDGLDGLAAAGQRNVFVILGCIAAFGSIVDLTDLSTIVADSGSEVATTWSVGIGALLTPAVIGVLACLVCLATARRIHRRER